MLNTWGPTVAWLPSINTRLNEIADEIELPDPPEPLEPEMTEKESRRAPLIDSAWGFIEGSLKLKASKTYENGDGDADDEGEDE